MSIINDAGGKSSREKDPLVSVIITTYYRNQALRSAIESVLGQTYDNIEIIVVDDSGEKHAMEVMNEFNDIDYIPKKENVGPNPARTTGFEQSEGKYIHFLDDDDRLLPQKIEKSVKELESDGNDDVGVVYSDYGWGDSTKTPDYKPHGEILEILLRELQFTPCVPSTMLIDREVLDMMIPLQPRERTAEGLTMRIELAQRTKFEYIHQALVDRRISEDSRDANANTTIEKIEIVDDYEDLYDSIGGGVRHAALHKLYREHSVLLLTNNTYSVSAVIAGAKSVKHMFLAEETSVTTIGIFAASIFGNPGYRLSRGIKNLVTSIRT